MSSWRGKTTISAEWRECDYEMGFARAFLEDLVAVMLHLLEE